MRTFKNLLATFSAFCWLARAGVVHVDVIQNGDVAVDIDLEPQDLKIENYHVDGDDNPRHQMDTQYTGPDDQYDVTLPYEIHRGFLSDDASYVKFSNIPFAEPPLGPLRFKAPIPPRKTRKDINVGSKERVCPQYQVGWVPKAFDFLGCYAGALNKTKYCSFKNNWTDPIDPSDYPEFDGSGMNENVNEDCLLLDVFVPKSVWDNRDTKVPVVAWIYGGGYIFGWKSQAGGPEPLLQAAKGRNKDIIYVAMNYRLGALGWLSGPDFIEDGGTPNAGLQDQRLALSWIQDYIGLFGGEKNSVTVMGQSAGGSSILHHVVAGAGAEKFKPNFSQAIMQSPAFFPEADAFSSNQVYAEFRIRLGSRYGSLEDLQQKSTLHIQLVNSLMTYYSNYGLFKFGPKVDHGYVPQLPGQLLLNNTYHKGIRMILGHTALDGLLFTPPWIRNDEAIGNYVKDLYPSTPDSVLEIMKNDSYYGIPDKETTLEITKINAVSDLLDDIAVSCNNYYLTNAAVKNDSTTPIWRYLFSAAPAIHGSDVFFTYYPTKDQPEFVNPELARFMQKKYVNFILDGDPNNREPLVWPKYQEGSRSVMKFGDLLLGNVSSVIRDPLNQNRCNLWQNAPFRDPEEDWILKEQSPNDQLEHVVSSPFVVQGL